MSAKNYYIQLKRLKDTTKNVNWPHFLANPVCSALRNDVMIVYEHLYEYLYKHQL